MNAEEVLKLAKLARIEVSVEEAETLSHEFESILKYVGEVKEVGTTDNRQPTTDNYSIKNVMREDGEGHEAGIYTEEILKNAPAREGDYIKVKKIL